MGVAGLSPMAPGGGAALWIPPVAPRSPAGGGYPEEVRAGPLSPLGLDQQGRMGVGAQRWGPTRLLQRMWCGHEGQLSSHGTGDMASGSGLGRGVCGGVEIISRYGRGRPASKLRTERVLANGHFSLAS